MSGRGNVVVTGQNSLGAALSAEPPDSQKQNDEVAIG